MSMSAVDSLSQPASAGSSANGYHSNAGPVIGQSNILHERCGGVQVLISLPPQKASIRRKTFGITLGSNKKN